MPNIKKNLGAFLMMTAAFALGRVVMSFAFVACAVAVGLSQAGGLTIGGALGSGSGGIDSVVHMLAPNTARSQTFAVIDVPAAVEARRKARGAQYTGGGSMIVAVGE